MPYLRHNIKCSVYLVVALNVRVICGWLFYTALDTSKEEHTDFLVEFDSTLSMIVKLILFTSNLALECYLAVVLIVTKERLTLLNDTLHRFCYLRNIAWSEPGTIDCRRVNVTEKFKLFNHLYLVYSILSETCSKLLSLIHI